MQSLDVIIVSWNVRELLNRCLCALHEDLDLTRSRARVWVVDNASSDGSAAMVHDHHPWVNLVSLADNLGFVRANNLILQKLIGTEKPDFVWFLNPDTEVRQGSTQTLLSALATLPRAGLVGPRLLNTDGSLQHGAFRFPDILQILVEVGWIPLRFYEKPLNGRYPIRNYANGSPFRIDYPLGAAMMARSEAIATVGLLDEGYVMYCEEIDWAWRMKKKSWDAWAIPQAEVVHHGSSSTKQVRPFATATLWESRARLFRRYRGAMHYRLARTIIRAHFGRKLSMANDPDWKQTYQRITSAWS